MKTKWPPNQPLEIKRGNVTLKIYRGKNRVNGTSYPQFTLAYYSGNQRVKRKFANLAEAKREGELVATKLANGENEVLRLTSADRTIYLQAVEELRPLNVPLNVAALEYSYAVKLLPKGVTLKEAVNYFVKVQSGLTRKTVAEVVAQLIEEKRNPPKKNRRPASDRYLSDMESRLGRFQAAFPSNIAEVEPAAIDAFLDSLKLGGRSIFNYARLITTLFNFAKAKSYYPKDRDPMEGLDIHYDDSSEIEIFSPHELTALLKSARPEMVPFIAIGAFAGLRHAELTRLDWSEIGPTHIEVKKAKAKTRSRRIVPIEPNLQMWLAPYRQKEGPVATLIDISKAFRKLGTAAKVEWKRNGLRHSFISYRLAIRKNENEVALEAGNSPQMIFANYRQLVTESEAAKWFSIQPFEDTNIIPMALPQTQRHSCFGTRS